MIAGKTETVYTIINSKPRPAETPGVNVTLITGNGSRLSLNSSTLLVSDPNIKIKYVAIHTFDVPSDVDDDTTIRLEFIQPHDWPYPGSLSSTIPVIPGERASRELEACTKLSIYIIFCVSLATYSLHACTGVRFHVALSFNNI